MKKYIFLLCLCLPVTVFAQPKRGVIPLLRSTTFSSNRLQQSLECTLARTQLSRLQQPHAISQVVLRPTPAPTASPLLQQDLILSPAQQQHWMSRYKQTLEKFEQFKKESFPFLYYQSFPLEAREISVHEKRAWLDKMIPLYNQVLSLYLNTQQDPPLQYALAYLRHGVSMTDPFLASTLPATTKPYATHFEANAFFLYPQQEPLPEPVADLNNKHIVIINDNNALLERLEHLANIGVLFPGATLHTQGDATQFLLWMQYSTVKPDIVFTDIQLGESNGYYIARRLRETGYKGGIIALTSYTQTEKYARQLAYAGFDGLVSLDDQYYAKTPFFLRITQAAQVYLHRKNQ